MASKIRYVEIKPIQQTLEFESQEKWHEFFEQRIKEIIDYTYSNNLNYEEYYVYHKVLLNKNGTPRKSINPKWLHSKKSQAKQKENWNLYIERRKKETRERTLLKQKAEIQYKIDCLKKQMKELGNEKL